MGQTRIHALCGAMLVVLASPALAQAQANFNVASQPLASGIEQVARQGSIQILSSPELTDGKRSAAVQGRLAPQAALTRLLAGTGLTFRASGSGFVIVAGQQAATADVAPLAAQPTPGENVANTESVAPEVVVTGSRIARRDYSSPTPIVTTSEQTIQQQGISNIEETLKVQPQFVAGGGATTTGRAAGGQRASLNLRGLGANRNLILLDGKRLPFSNAQGVVDVNIIPSALVQSVETITGGASAVYGSDAMSGVVNFQTRRVFSGLQVDAQYGNTFKTDRFTRDITLTSGGEFLGGRGRAVMAIGYSDRQRLRAEDRDFLDFATPSGFFGAGAYIPTATNLPSQAALNSVFTSYDGQTSTVPRTGGTANIGFNDDGTLFLVQGARNYRGRTSGDYFILDGAVRHPFGSTLDVTSKQQRRFFFGKFSYDLRDGLEAYSQLLYVDSETDQDDGTSLTQYGTLDTIPITNPFIPAGLRTILASRTNPTAPFEWNTRYVGVGHKAFNDRLLVSQGIVGVRGRVGVKDWQFDVYYSSDQSNLNQTIRNAVLKDPVQRLYNAADGGRSLCTGGFNPFGDANARGLSQSCQDFITATLHNSQEIEQNIVEGSLQGGLFNLPAGELRFSLVADRRVQTYKYVPDSRLRDQGAVEAISAQVGTAGKLTVNEISGELLIPVLRDKPFFQSFNIGAAFRYSDYNYAGGNSTYKVDTDWTITDGILIRGGYARAVRAPNMAESFFDRQSSAAPIGTPPTGGEPCDIRTPARMQGGAQLRALCIATGVPASVVDALIVPTSSAGNSVTSGNRNLSPETANTYTAGLVLRPRFGPAILRAFSASVDFYDITIKNVIGTIAAPTVLNACYNQNGLNPDFSAANVYCTLLHRDQNGILTSVDTPYLNLGGLHVRGIDFSVDWRSRVGPGTLSLGTAISYKLKDETKDFANSPWVDLVGTGTRYRLSTVTNLSYQYRGVLAGLRFRYTPSQDDPTFVTRPASPAPGVKSFFAIDFNSTIEVRQGLQLRAGVTNLYQPKPPLPNQTTPQTSGLYDAVGRQFYLAVRAKF